MSDKENNDHDFQPPKNRARGKSKRGEAARDRFKAPISEKEMANTQRNTAWAMRVFQEWKAERSKEASKCPEDLDNPDIKNLNLLAFTICDRNQEVGWPALSDQDYSSNSGRFAKVHAGKAAQSSQVLGSHSDSVS